MSEEEKKAIETMNTIIEFGGDNFLCKEHKKQLQTILNLIEKQQKEIKELKEKEKNLLNQLKDNEKELLEVTQNVISKDKIRELLQRYDKGIAWANADDHYYFVKFIKELLDEIEDNSLNKSNNDLNDLNDLQIIKIIGVKDE